MEPTQVLDMVYKFGALPLLLFAVYKLWGKVEAHEKSIEELNRESKQQLINNAVDSKSLHQNTLNTINTMGNKISQLIDFLKK